MESMSRYKKYKDSGIEWIGDVPNHWEIRKIKQCLKPEKNAIKTGPFGSDLKFDDLVEDGIKVYNQRSVLDKDWSSGEGFISDKKYAELETCTIFPNDIVITTRGTIGKAAIFPNNADKGILHPCLMRIQLNQSKCFVPFIEMIINDASYFLDALKFQSNATTIEVIYSDTLKEIKIALPPFEEQLTIANYLDSQTQKIDQLIANKKAQAQKLKELRQIEINNAVTKGLNPHAEMKDSGIDWLGEIPRYWEVKHLKRVFKFYNNIRIPLSSEERADLENIYDYYGASGVIDKVDRFLFDGDYILIGEDGANLLDRNSPLAFKASGKFWVNNHAHIIKPINGDIDFYTFLLESIDFTIYITGSAQPKLTIEQLSSVPVLVLPKEEQIEIAKYLKHRTNGIDTLIKNINFQIEKLQELRKIKIYEAVTGKIKIAEAAIHKQYQPID